MIKIWKIAESKELDAACYAVRIFWCKTLNIFRVKNQWRCGNVRICLER